MDRTKPDAGTITGYSGVIRTRAGLRASWFVETGMAWEDYRRWATGRLVPGFEASSSGGSSLEFRKAFDDDYYIVVLENVPGQSPARVGVTVEGRPH